VDHVCPPLACSSCDFSEGAEIGLSFFEWAILPSDTAWILAEKEHPLFVVSVSSVLGTPLDLEGSCAFLGGELTPSAGSGTSCAEVPPRRLVMTTPFSYAW